MRIVFSVVVLVLLPATGFFLWAWLVAMARERRLAGTLPHWQDLPWTWLIIAGLALALAGILYLVLLTDRPEGGWFGPPHDAATQRLEQTVVAGTFRTGHSLAYARTAPPDQGGRNTDLEASKAASAFPAKQRRRHAAGISPVAGEEA